MQQGGDSKRMITTAGLPASETTNIHTGHPWTLVNSYSIDNGILYAFYAHQMALKSFHKEEEQTVTWAKRQKS
jgi:hypothetical protein